MANDRYYGKFRGLVVDVDDPLGRLRVRVRVPAVLGERPTSWALPSLPLGVLVSQANDSITVRTGDNLESDVAFDPILSKGMNVWVEFEQGDLDNPIVTGAFFA